MGLCSRRRPLRLFKATELVGAGLDVARTVMELGHGSMSAFVYAFRMEMGCGSPAYMRGRAPGCWRRSRPIRHSAPQPTDHPPDSIVMWEKYSRRWVNSRLSICSALGWKMKGRRG